jgi:hypothetical protein
VEEGAKSLRRQSLQVLLNGMDLCWVMVITVIESVHVRMLTQRALFVLMQYPKRVAESAS